MEDRVKIVRILRTDAYSNDGVFCNVVELEIDGRHFIEWLDDDWSVPTNGTAALEYHHAGEGLPDDIEPEDVWKVIDEYVCAGFKYDDEEEAEVEEEEA